MRKCKKLICGIEILVRILDQTTFLSGIARNTCKTNNYLTKEKKLRK